jgi:predicted RNA-binding protein with PIN domain
MVTRRAWAERPSVVSEIEAPEIGIAELPPEVATLLVRWVSQWLAQTEKPKIPVALAPYVGFRADHHHRRVKETFRKELSTSAAMRKSLAEWLDSGDHQDADKSKKTTTAMARAWLHGDTTALSGLLDTRSQKTADQSVDAPQVEKLESEVAKLLSDLDRARRDAKKVSESRRRDPARQSKDLSDARSEMSRLQKTVQDLKQEASLLRDTAQEESRRVAQVESTLGAQIRSLEKELDLARTQRHYQRRSSRHLERIEAARIQVLLAAAQSAIEGLGSELSAESPNTPSQVARSKQSVANPLPRKLGGDLVQQWLTTPGLHLLVDGYNVTMAATPDLPLAQQRELLSSRLAALASRTGAEITVVFDAQHVNVVMPSASRKGVLVIFTDEGELADDVLVELVSLEPPGRAVLVITSDQEVVQGVTRLGARALSSQEFNEALDRG